MINIKYPNENQIVIGKNVGIKKFTITFHSFSTFFFLLKQIQILGWKVFIGVGGDENLKIYLVWPKLNIIHIGND